MFRSSSKQKKWFGEINIEYNLKGVQSIVRRTVLMKEDNIEELKIYCPIGKNIKIYHLFSLRFVDLKLKNRLEKNYFILTVSIVSFFTAVLFKYYVSIGVV
jgi:hypothetical protein